MNDNILLQHLIEQEIAQNDYYIPPEDRILLDKMLLEMNRITGVNIHYLAELDYFGIKGAGETVKKYILLYRSESVRSYLLHHLVNDRVKDCGKLIYQMYLHFKASDEYISPPNESAPAHIYVRYDNAFKRLKSKRIKTELFELSHFPRDAFYLPFTMRMLASWKIPELEQVFLSYLDDSYVTNESLGLPQQDENYYPSASFIKRELKFTAIACLKYYPSDNVLAKLNEYSESEDKDIRSAINKTIGVLKKIYC